MGGSDPKCVHVDHNMAIANFIATWLGSQGIPAQVMNEEVLGGFEGLASISGNLGSRGVEVWVDDAADADKARQLLEEKAAELKAARAVKTGTVEVVCEECGKRTIFPAETEGSVQECPKCAAYMDIPGVDDDWDNAEIDAMAEGE